MTATINKRLAKLEAGSKAYTFWSWWDRDENGNHVPTAYKVRPSGPVGADFDGGYDAACHMCNILNHPAPNRKIEDYI